MRDSLALLGILAALFISARRRKLVLSSVPIMSNRYWSQAMRRVGWDSVALMEGHYAINAQTDFDLYLDDLVPKRLRRTRAARLLTPALTIIWIVRNARVMHLT